MIERTPRTIPELWYRLDKRLSLIEQRQQEHTGDHAGLDKTLTDHENRIRASGTASSLVAGGSGILSLLAVIKAFIGGN